MYLIAQNYLWCAEKNWLQTAPLALGLIANVILNLALLPAFGLYGCVLAAAGGALVCLVSVLELNRRHGMTIDRGVWMLAIAPAALGLGPWPAVTAALALAALALASNALFSESERRQLWTFAVETIAKLLPLRLRPATSS